MILEGIVTTIDRDGHLNVAPMGPAMEPGGLQFVLRPFRTSRTYANLKATGEGVLHVHDDPLLLARAAIGDVKDAATTAASVVRGRILTSCCRYMEFRVASLDDAEERTRIEASTVATGRFRDAFGWNRGQFAVVEAAIMATRVGIIAIEEILNGLDRLAVVVEKTGGPAEREAFTLLTQHVARAAGIRERGAGATGP